MDRSQQKLGEEEEEDIKRNGKLILVEIKSWSALMMIFGSTSATRFTQDSEACIFLIRPPSSGAIYMAESSFLRVLYILLSTLDGHAYAYTVYAYNSIKIHRCGTL